MASLTERERVDVALRAVLAALATRQYRDAAAERGMQELYTLGSLHGCALASAVTACLWDLVGQIQG